MKFSQLALGMALSIITAATSNHAIASSSVALRSHDPALACVVIGSALAEMTGRIPRADWPIYYSETFGTVEYNEYAAFVKSMTYSEGRQDKSPLQLTFVWPVGEQTENKTRAMYVVGLQRNKWQYERQASFDPMQMEPEGFYPTPSYWLVEFVENRIHTMREGSIFFNFVEYNKRLKSCGQYGG